ncbi:AEC family transporter [Pelobacter seleniigenes]|uniref:AEC family transporter n=1 Tax=Pelobacter seleniigenes TaxID=407188 RepID=UPI0004A76216|nr:AEC family transporter [Pelobacter seleniigenes]
MQKILFSLVLIISGLICGYLLQQLIRFKYQQAERVLPRLRKVIQYISMLGIMPISFVGVLWIISFDNLRIILLPFVAVVLLLTGGGLGLLGAKLLNRTGAQKSVMFSCGFFSNLGSIGGLISYVFLGEQGFAMLALYRIFEEILYYSVGFPLTKYFKTDDENLNILRRVMDLGRDPFFIVATSGFLLGLALNFSGVQRPPQYETLNSFFVPIGTFMILMSVGLGMRFSSISHNLPEGLTIATIKHLILPVIGATTAWLLGFHHIDNGLPFKIVLLCTSMPIAFNALVVSSIYDLDLDLANTCWLISTSCLVAVVPLLYFLFELI